MSKFCEMDADVTMVLEAQLNSFLGFRLKAPIVCGNVLLI